MTKPAFAALVVKRPEPKAPGKRQSRKATAAGRIELVVAGVTVRIGADVDEGQLARVIRAVRAAAE